MSAKDLKNGHVDCINLHLCIYWSQLRRVYVLCYFSRRYKFTSLAMARKCAGGFA